MAIQNKIIKGYLETFKQEYSIPSKTSEPDLFEHFANYCVLSKIHPDAFDNDAFKIQDVNIGGGNDTGIDGLAIIVNGNMVSNIQEIDDIIGPKGRKIEVRFIFIQSKTSASFDASMIGTFIYGVKDFFKDSPTLKTTEELEQLRDMQKHIYSKSILLSPNPTCEIFYVTTGKWVDDHNVSGRAETEITQIDDLDIFSDVTFNPIDAKDLEILYKEVKNRVTKEINFERNTPLPRIANINEAYIGILPLSEYFNLIEDSSNKLQRSLFYDNVRDFQGMNSVNKEITETLTDSVKQFKFPILNNGITIVSKNLKKTGTYFTLTDFQIVNGCQTSNVLFQNKKSIDIQNVYVPIKLIYTEDQDVINDVIKATNRQTEIKIEAFESLKEYHKMLQNHYNSAEDNEDRLYYERRSKEYDQEFPPIPKARIITLAAQVNSAISIFWNEPHSTHRYFGELLKSYKGKIFQDEHKPEIYFSSASGLAAIDNLIREEFIDRKYKKFKYHLLMLIREIALKDKMPQMNSKQMIKYGDKLTLIFQDEAKLKLVIPVAIKILDITISEKRSKFKVRDMNRLKEFTVSLLNNGEKLMKK